MKPTLTSPDGIPVGNDSWRWQALERRDFVVPYADLVEPHEAILVRLERRSKLQVAELATRGHARLGRHDSYVRRRRPTAANISPRNAQAGA
jgi:hypothetical protein